jgi:hypothetical protein
MLVSGLLLSRQNTDQHLLYHSKSCVATFQAPEFWQHKFAGMDATQQAHVRLHVRVLLHCNFCAALSKFWLFGAALGSGQRACFYLGPRSSGQPRRARPTLFQSEGPRHDVNVANGPQGVVLSFWVVRYGRVLMYVEIDVFNTGPALVPVLGALSASCLRVGHGTVVVLLPGHCPWLQSEQC